MCVFNRHVGDAKERGGAAVDCDEQHVLTTLLQAPWPLSKALEGDTEIGEQRGIPDNHGVPVDRARNTPANGVVPSIDGTHMNVALARTVENGDGERSVEPSG
jgi:hypothetical protein